VSLPPCRRQKKNSSTSEDNSIQDGDNKHSKLQSRISIALVSHSIDITPSHVFSLTLTHNCLGANINWPSVHTDNRNQNCDRPLPVLLGLTLHLFRSVTLTEEP
jgi:hypothetical protein